MPEPIEIHGFCDPAFESVKSVFKKHFEQGKEIGAGLAVTVDGRLVLNLWAGHADRKRTAPWCKDTLVNVFSSTKGVTATCILRLVDQGLLDLDQPMVRYWPEFGQDGKAEITVRQILSHRAGVPAVSTPLPAEAIFDWETMVEALAAQAPWWPPGTRHGYHARTYGWLAGELVRRVIGKSIGDYLREEITAPLDIDFHIGLPDSQHSRVAFITKMPPPPPGVKPYLGSVMVREPESVTAMAFTNPPLHKIADGPNTARWRRAEIPSSNGHATAEALARFYGILACGGSCDNFQLLTAERIAEARTEHSRGEDAVLLTPTRFGLGFMMPMPGNAMGPNDNAFGHPGMGGSLGFADPEARVGFGYVMNRSQGYILIDDRPAALIGALYESL